MKLESIRVGAHIEGLILGQVVEVVQVKAVSTDACQVTYRGDSGILDDQLILSS